MRICISRMQRRGWEGQVDFELEAPRGLKRRGNSRVQDFSLPCVYVYLAGCLKMFGCWNGLYFDSLRLSYHNSQDYVQDGFDSLHCC